MPSPKPPHLKVADPKDVPEPPKPREVPKSITAALEGSARDVYAAMRQKLARQIDAGEVSSNAIRSAYQELRELDRLIRAEDAAEAAERESRERDEQRPRRSFDASAI